MATALLSGCGGSAPADPGLHALLQVDGAQFYPGALPGRHGGPAVISASVSRNQINAGSRELPLVASLGKTATGALVGLVGDAGYFALEAGAPAFEAPDFPTLTASLSFSSALESKDYVLRVEAVDADGRVGAPDDTTLTGHPRATPDGTLVVTLSWDTEADLDLHVVTPKGVEIFARDINSIAPPPPGKPMDPEAWKAGGILDFDSNAQCVIDGLRQEDVYWTVPPPSGHYVVRVDTFSLCGVPGATWRVSATLNGRSLGRAEGTTGPADAMLPHDRGAGVLALELDVP